MLKYKNIKRLASYPILFALIMQLGLTSLLCAVSGTQAGASTLTICTNFGIKTITLDETGNPVEQSEHGAFHATCFHCATGGCMSLALLPNQDLFINNDRTIQISTIHQRGHGFAATLPPPSRAPPAIG